MLECKQPLRRLVIKHHFLVWRLKSLNALNPMRQYMFKDLWWFGASDHFFPLLLSLSN